jgi:uncharacterized SAM-binding protein YcdF (DUF218 family)
MAAWLQRQGITKHIYVSGDSQLTVSQLQQLGVPQVAISGDSCARTTAENAQRTSIWLKQHGIGSVILITDPWQLARAARLFHRRGISVIPLAVSHDLSISQANRLALRECLAFALYWLQGRL